MLAQLHHLIAQHGRFLELQSLRRFLHLLLQLDDHLAQFRLGQIGNGRIAAAFFSNGQFARFHECHRSGRAPP